MEGMAESVSPRNKFDGSARSLENFSWWNVKRVLKDIIRLPGLFEEL